MRSSCIIMDLANYGVSEKYKEYSKYGDSLNEMGEKIGWESLRYIFQDIIIIIWRRITINAHND
ncbi:MAG: hypothetical protein QXZ44_04080 [Ferroplasma sp.]